MNTFKEIIGHKDIINHIQKAIDHGKISHAYILDGPRGSGKKTIANAFAKTLQCEKKEAEPCNECISCNTFDSGNHPDIIHIKKTKKRSIGVNDIRDQIQTDIEIKPYKYNYKIYIIDEADILTEQAQNALLKTIEEPPSYAIIMLLSNNLNKFLVTILSRCVVLKLNPINNKYIKKYLMDELQIPDYQAELYTSFGQGVIGKSKELAVSKEFSEMREHIIELLDRIHGLDIIEIMEMHKELETYKDRIDTVFEILYTWFRDILFIKGFGDNKYLINKDKSNILLKQANQLSFNKISKIIDSIGKAKDEIRYNANFQLSIELMLMNMK